MRIGHSLIVLVIVTAAACLAAPQQGGATDKDRIQGTWKFVSVLDQGVEQPMPDAIRVVITSDLLTMVYPKDDPTGWKYTIDPSKDPKQMDWLSEEEPGRPIRQPGIYSLEGDTLKICSAAAGKPRPTRFESKRGDFGGLWTLKRVGPAPTKEPAR